MTNTFELIIFSKKETKKRKQKESEINLRSLSTVHGKIHGAGDFLKFSKIIFTRGGVQVPAVTFFEPVDSGSRVPEAGVKNKPALHNRAALAT